MKKYTILIGLFFLIIFLTGCVKTQPPVDTTELLIYRNYKDLYYESSLSISGDGTVTYTATGIIPDKENPIKGHTGIIENKQEKLSNKELQRVIRTFEENNFFNLKEKYYLECEENKPNMGVGPYIYFFKIGSIEKSVMVAKNFCDESEVLGSIPAELDKIEKKVR